MSLFSYAHNLLAEDNNWLKRLVFGWIEGWLFKFAWNKQPLFLQQTVTNQGTARRRKTIQGTGVYIFETHARMHVGSRE